MVSKMKDGPAAKVAKRTGDVDATDPANKQRKTPAMYEMKDGFTASSIIDKKTIKKVNLKPLAQRLAEEAERGHVVADDDRTQRDYPSRSECKLNGRISFM